MTETRHVRLDYESALNSKKELLSAELNLLQILRKIKYYKTLRKDEFILKNKLRMAITALKTKTNTLQNNFPLKKSKIKIQNISNEKVVKKQKSRVTDELENIKKKLEELNK